MKFRFLSLLFYSFIFVYFFSFIAKAEENYIQINYGITSHDSSVTDVHGAVFDNADEGYKILDLYIELQGISALTKQEDIIYDPLWENLRKDPRYIDLLKKLKLYDYWKNEPEIKKLEKGK